MILWPEAGRLPLSLVDDGRIEGSVQVCNRDPDGNSNLLQEEVSIAYLPDTRSSPCVSGHRDYRGQLFGPALPDGRDPSDVFYISLDLLRRCAIDGMRDAGYMPA